MMLFVYVVAYILVGINIARFVDRYVFEFSETDDGVGFALFWPLGVSIAIAIGILMLIGNAIEYGKEGTPR